jgi:hypothetical protein
MNDNLANKDYRVASYDGLKSKCESIAMSELQATVVAHNLKIHNKSKVITILKRGAYPNEAQFYLHQIIK